MDSISSLTRKLENSYITGTTTLSKYVQDSQYERVNTIEAYINSKHISGDQDSLGREKPFKNIVVSARNIWWRATDIDRARIKFHATKQSDSLATFLATVHLQDWMRRENFGSFLKEWGRVLATYGSAIVKFVEVDGKLHCVNVPWNRVITDTVDFDPNPKIEVLYFTPGQLAQKGISGEYDADMVKDLLKAREARTTLDKQRKDNLSDYIKVYEIHGLLPLSYLTGEEDDKDIYQQQMQVLSFMGKKTGNNRISKGEYDEFVLYKGKEAKDPYMITHLIKEDGQVMAIGAVQNLFEAQWMINHTAKAIKDQLDLASKILFQTADPNFVGQNALSAMNTGDILIHAPQSPLTQVPNNSHDITEISAYADQWKAIGQEINGISEAMMGATPPSGQAWRQTMQILNESHTLFDDMTKNKGLYIEAMMREFILPFYRRTQMNTTKEVAGTLDSYGIQKVDTLYVKNEAIKRNNANLIDQVLAGKMAQNNNIQQLQAQVQSELNQDGNVRYFKPSEQPDKTWADAFEDIEWNLEVEVTDEDKDRQGALATLDNLFTRIVANPAAFQQTMQDANARLVFNKILDMSGAVSPVELSSQPQSQPQQQAPANKVSESVSYKDLPANGQIQLAQQAGIKLTQQDVGVMAPTAASAGTGAPATPQTIQTAPSVAQ